MKKTLKSLAGRALHVTGLHRKLLNDTGVIVAFHRVDDRNAGDALTVSVDAFESFCRFFKRHYDVISLGDFVTRLEHGMGVAVAERASPIMTEDSAAVAKRGGIQRMVTAGESSPPSPGAAC